MRGVKGTGPNAALAPDEPMEAIPVKMAYFYEPITWPGVPKSAELHLSEERLPGLKMYLVWDKRFLYMEINTPKGLKHTLVPMPIRSVILHEPLEL